MHVLYCALCVGFLDDIVIGCMVVPPSIYYPCCRCTYLFRLDVLRLVDCHQ
jgi:hypothetical protein